MIQNGRAAAVRSVVVAALWIALAIYSATVTHDFFRYVDRSIYVSVDDSEANIAYSLAHHGRYGFPASPVLAGQLRTDGQFNYGPWYFYLAAALSWVFGFSLTLVRSIHLWGVFTAIALAAFWFKGRDRTPIAVLFALGILYCFDASQWPMARPDIMVSVFALVLVVAAGRGTLEGKPAQWCVAGLAATCGAFTHLIAFTLLPAVALLFGVATWLAIRDSADRSATWRRAGLSAAGLAAGVAAGLTMFYASFGFDIAMQLRFLTAYRELTASPVSVREALSHHLTHAYGYLPLWVQNSVWVTLAAGWILPVAAVRLPAANRREVIAFILPPVVLWTGYLTSNGWYTNYHTGYAILNQVLFLWTLTAFAWLILRFARTFHARAGAVVAAIVVVLIFAQTARQLAWQASGQSWKVERTATWVAFSEYSSQVLSVLPAGATAWGSIILGIEAPDRVNLVQWSDAAILMGKTPPSQRPAVNPDYIVWTYSEARDNMLSATRGGPTLLSTTQNLMGEARIRLAAMVAAAPYGVTRTYARYLGRIDPSRSTPSVSVYDPGRRQWLTRLDEAAAAVFAPTAPVVLRIGYEAEPPASVPNSSVQAELPPNRYLLKVALKPGRGKTARRLLAATSQRMLRQTISETGPEGDFAAYLDDDTQLFMLIMHTGGPLYVSQFDDGAAPAIESVIAYPIVGLLDPLEAPMRSAELPPLTTWVPTPGVDVQVAGSTLRANGDATASGYQLTSPLINVRARHFVTVRVPLSVEGGKACVGILNGDARTWMVPPDISRGELGFVVDATQGFRVVVANCNPKADVARSRFVLGPGTYLDDPAGESYADRLVAAALNRGEDMRSEMAGPKVRTAPAGLEVTKALVEGMVEPLAPEDLAYRAAIVQQRGSEWLIKGQAEGRYTYLLRFTERRLGTDRRLVVRGRVEKGGLSIGLLRDNKWTSQIDITDPGDFTVLIAPPSPGPYSLIVANNLPAGLESSAVLTKVGFLRR